MGTITGRHPSMRRWVTVLKVNVEAEDVAVPVKRSSDVGDPQDDLCSVDTVAVS